MRGKSVNSRSWPHCGHLDANEHSDPARHAGAPDLLRAVNEGIKPLGRLLGTVVRYIAAGQGRESKTQAPLCCSAGRRDAETEKQTRVTLLHTLTGIGVLDH